MQRLLAGMVIALGFHALLLMVPIQHHQAVRSRLPKTGGITVEFSRIEPIAPRNEARFIPPPPGPILPQKERIEKQQIDMKQPPKSKPKTVLVPRQEIKMTPVVSVPRRKPLSRQADTSPMPKKNPQPSRPEVKEREPTLADQPEHPDAFPPVNPSKIGKETRQPLAAQEPAVGMIDKTKVPPLVSQAYPVNDDNPPPKYPVLARRRGWQGTVHLSVLVMANGGVGDITIAKSSGYPILDETALKAVTRYRFVPGRQGDRPISMRVQVPVHFRLRDIQ
mgnify:FL=1